MDVKVISYDEHEDGSATVELDLPKDIVERLIQIGFTQILRKAIEHETN